MLFRLLIRRRKNRLRRVRHCPSCKSARLVFMASKKKGYLHYQCMNCKIDSLMRSAA